MARPAARIEPADHEFLAIVPDNCNDDGASWRWLPPSRRSPPAKPCPLPSGRLFSLSRPCLWQATLLPPRGEPRWWNKRRRNSSDGSGASLRRSRRRAPRRPPFTGLRPGAAGPARAGRTRSLLSWKRTTSRRTTCPPRSSPLGDNHSSTIHQSILVTRGSRLGPPSRKRHLLCHRAPHIVRPHTGWWVQMQRACLRGTAPRNAQSCYN
jgi:hypothetical protein